MKNEQSLKFTDREIKLLKRKLDDGKYKLFYRPLIFLLPFSILFAVPLKWIPGRSNSSSSSYEILGTVECITVFILITILIIFITIKEFDLFNLKRDLEEQKKTVLNGTVARSGAYQGEYYIKLKSGKPRFLRSNNRKLLKYRRGDEITFEVSKNSKNLLNIL